MLRVHGVWQLKSLEGKEKELCIEFELAIRLGCQYKDNSLTKNAQTSNYDLILKNLFLKLLDEAAIRIKTLLCGYICYFIFFYTNSY